MIGLWVKRFVVIQNAKIGAESVKNLASVVMVSVSMVLIDTLVMPAGEALYANTIETGTPVPYANLS